jgi:hypothetical protein
MYNQVSKVTSGLIPVIASLAFSVPAYSATFTSEADWQNAAGNYRLETFESLGSLGVEISTLSSLGIDFATTHNIYNGNSGGPLFGRFSLINTYPFNRNQLDGFFITASGGELISALGVWNASGDDELFLRFYDEFDVIMESLVISASRTQATFGGIVSNQGASRVEIVATGNANRWIAIDNLQISSNVITPEPPIAPPGAAVPEPTTILGIALSGGGLACLKRRRSV